jgi:hypothetical protein
MMALTLSKRKRLTIWREHYPSPATGTRKPATKENNMERWKAIKGFEGLYEISDHGRVRSITRKVSDGRLYRGKILKLNEVGNNRNGTKTHSKIRRKYANLNKNTIKYHLPVTELVAEAFILDYDPGKRTKHLDGDRLNNHYENLIQD